MDLQSKSNNSGSEALEPIELPVFEKTHSIQYPFLAEIENPLLHYWRIIKKRRWTVVATLCIISALSVIFTLKTTSLYQASSTVAIFPESPNVLGFKGLEENSPASEYDVTLETQAAIFRSDALAMKVIEATHLDQGSTVMKEHLARWRNEFDHIIIDSPPCLTVTDSVVLSPGVDRLILVVRAKKTTKLALRQACELLLQVNARVMGIVLNALTWDSAESYYYYGGRYSDRYYHEGSGGDKPADAVSKVS